MSYRRPAYQRRRTSSDWGFGLAVILVIIAVVVGLGAYLTQAHKNHTVVAKVTDKARVCESAGGSCKYLIYTDHGTLKNTDSLFSGKFDSSDVYGRIRRGQTYTFTVEGFRFGFFSMYPNIVSAEKVR